MNTPPGRSTPPHPRRPTRLDRLFENVVPVYFVTFNTYRRHPLLARNEVHDTYVDFCRRAAHYSIAVGRYVLMPDHVHLFVALPEIGERTLGAWIGALKNALGKTLLKLGVSKPHWQDGFFDHVIRNEESHAYKWDYVRLNPTRAGLCHAPEEWPYQGEIVAL